RVPRGAVRRTLRRRATSGRLRDRAEDPGGLVVRHAALRERGGVLSRRGAGLRAAMMPGCVNGSPTQGIAVGPGSAVDLFDANRVRRGRESGLRRMEEHAMPTACDVLLEHVAGLHELGPV